MHERPKTAKNWPFGRNTPSFDRVVRYLLGMPGMYGVRGILEYPLKVDWHWVNRVIDGFIQQNLGRCGRVLNDRPFVPYILLWLGCVDDNTRCPAYRLWVPQTRTASIVRARTPRLHALCAVHATTAHTEC